MQTPFENRTSPASDRRAFLKRAAQASAVVALLPAILRGQPAAAPRKMTLCLTPGSIGVSANQMQAIELAHAHGFEAVEPFPSHIASLTEDQIDSLRQTLKDKNLSWGAAGLTVDFRGDDARFADTLKTFPQTAAALRRANVTRVGTWISPAHNTLTYLQNFRQHARRLRESAQILKDHGIRLGLEYVGTQTLRNRMKYPFIHTLAETRELIAEIGTGNVGFVPDSWHWWTAGDTAADLRTLTDADVISVDLNDAPAGIPKDQQIDGRRELPLATGVIDLKEFLTALRDIGYTGPVRPEPFNKPLNDLDNEAACAQTIGAMRKAMDLL